jgi:hypothetical protein
MFDPALAGYSGDADPKRAMETALAIINANAAKVDGVKISLLDKDMEIAPSGNRAQPRRCRARQIGLLDRAGLALPAARASGT